jgi:hypothetical protein
MAESVVVAACQVASRLPPFWYFRSALEQFAVFPVRTSSVRCTSCMHLIKESGWLRKCLLSY